MSDLSQTVPGLLAEADRAASSGDLALAEELLKGAARLQEQELGPLHPDLANTVNNLAIVAEAGGRLDDAETLYRRAVAITSASLAPDNPAVAASRKNLEDFCRAHDIPIDKPGIAKAPAEAVDVVKAAPPPVATVVAPSPAPAVPKPSRMPAMLGIGLAVVVIGAVLIVRPWSARQAPAAVTAPAPAVEADPVRPAPATSAPAPAPADREPAPTRSPAPAPASGISLVAVTLCRNFSATDWRCDPAGDSVAPGPLVLYSRVRSPRDGLVIHRWYRGDELRKSAQLRVGANASEGYRTYSRQTVDRGDWRVEVRSEAGDLLHEQRFAVR